MTQQRFTHYVWPYRSRRQARRKPNALLLENSAQDGIALSMAFDFEIVDLRPEPMKQGDVPEVKHIQVRISILAAGSLARTWIKVDPIDFLTRHKRRDLLAFLNAFNGELPPDTEPATMTAPNRKCSNVVPVFAILGSIVPKTNLLTQFTTYFDQRVAMFLIGLAILCAVRYSHIFLPRSAGPSPDSSRADRLVPSTWNLVFASFLTLFAELAFIRWIAVEVRIFAYFKNLALLLCFVGFGLGCALVTKPIRWERGTKAFLGLLLVIRLPFWSGKVLESLSQDLGGASGTQIWNTGSSIDWLRFFSAGLLVSMLFLLLVMIFVPLGQIVSRQLNIAPRTLHAYSWNLFGSLGGILAFFAVSRLMLPAWVWLGFIMLGFALVQDARRNRSLALVLVLPLILIVYEPNSQDHFVLWTPYHQIDYTRIYSQRNGEFALGNVQVNHTYYQRIIDLSERFLARHPGLEPRPEESHYNLPFRFTKSRPTVLIVGAGTGDDAAAALRYESPSVDAVEIDPGILELGRREHPEHPYESRRVGLYVTDARAFLRRTTKRYDLVLFGLVDSHTQLSDFSNMRIDNFVYTEESFREARARLSSDGVLFLKFETSVPWMVRRLAEMLQDAFGKPPVVFHASTEYSGEASCFVISISDRVQDAVHSDPMLAEFINRNHIEVPQDQVPVTTDDWPYLYQSRKEIPQLCLLISGLVVVLAMILYLQIPQSHGRTPSLFFFFAGAGFMLLEAQAVSRLALYFGTTWRVNGVVLSALLVALLAANMVEEKYGKLLAQSWIVAGLLLGLLAAYSIPFSRIRAEHGVIGVAVAVTLTIPVFFAGILFSQEFGRAELPSTALGANIIGAVLGGILENVSLILGLHALLLLALVVYSAAIASLRTPLLWKNSLELSSAATGERLNRNKVRS